MPDCGYPFSSLGGAAQFTRLGGTSRVLLILAGAPRPQTPARRRLSPILVVPSSPPRASGRGPAPRAPRATGCGSAHPVSSQTTPAACLPSPIRVLFTAAPCRAAPRPLKLPHRATLMPRRPGRPGTGSGARSGPASRPGGRSSAGRARPTRHPLPPTCHPGAPTPPPGPGFALTPPPHTPSSSAPCPPRP